MSSYINPEKIPLLVALRRAALLKQTWKRGYGKMSPLDSKLVHFMAEIFPDEGLDIFLGQFPKNDTRVTTTYLCLFTSQTATTVITALQTLSSITETSYTSYARQSLATATWGALADKPTNLGRQTSYSQITFPTVGTTGATINGFFIGDATPPVKAIAQANFDDGAAVPLNTNDIIKVTPTIALLH